MKTDYTRLASVLKSNGYSLTKPRQLIFETLSDHKTLTMLEITKQLAGQADRASIYRSVSLFEELGIIHRINLGWKYKIELSDTFAHHHHHFSCQNCGVITTLRDDLELEQQITKLAEWHGLIMSEHQLEIHGLCQDCQSK